MGLPTLLTASVLTVFAVSVQAMPVLEFENAKGISEGDSISNQYNSGHGLAFSGNALGAFQAVRPAFGNVQGKAPRSGSALRGYAIGAHLDNRNADQTLNQATAAQGVSFDGGVIDGLEEVQTQPMTRAG